MESDKKKPITKLTQDESEKMVLKFDALFSEFARNSPESDVSNKEFVYSRAVVRLWK